MFRANMFREKHAYILLEQIHGQTEFNTNTHASYRTPMGQNGKKGKDKKRQIEKTLMGIHGSRSLMGFQEPETMRLRA